MCKRFVIASKKVFWISLLILVLLITTIIAAPINLQIKNLIIQSLWLLLTFFLIYVSICQIYISINKYFEEFKKRRKNYLDLFIEVKKEGVNFFKIKTQVINNSGEDKEIEYAFLTINRQEHDIINDMKNFMKDLTYTNDFIKLKEEFDLTPRAAFKNNQIAIIPLDFYFSENIRIGNENPSFTYIFDNKKANFESGIYVVRFFVFPQDNNQYHRSCADAFVIE